MNTPLQIVLLFMIWYLFWGIYNLKLVKENVTTEKSPKFMVVVYILLSIIFFFLSDMFSNYVLYLMIIVLSLGFIVKNKISGRIANSTFQMSWLMALHYIGTFSSLSLAILFFIGHLPIVVVQHLSFAGKLLVLVFSFLGGYFIALVITTYPLPYNLLIATLLHFITYVILRPFDHKYHLGIIN